MSALNVWILCILSYLLGVWLGMSNEGDNNLRGFAPASSVIGFIILLILIGVKIGGAA